MKKIIIIGLMMVLLCAGRYLFAGSIDSSAIPSDDTTRMYTIKNIYDYLTDVDNAPPNKSTGGFSEPIAGPASTMYTLDNVFNKLQRFPATGQATCYNTAGTLIDCAGTGQDGAYQKGATQRYNIYAIGSDYVTVDLNTGLMWASYGNAAGCNNGATATWANALTYCEGLTFAGYSDWRLPNVSELFSIVQQIPAAVGPFINTTAFPNTLSSLYWSSTTLANGTTFALNVYFSYGYVYYSNKTNSTYVRCVRGG